jgi:hypothetical protein
VQPRGGGDATGTDGGATDAGGGARDNATSRRGEQYRRQGQAVLPGRLVVLLTRVIVMPVSFLTKLLRASGGIDVAPCTRATLCEGYLFFFLCREERCSWVVSLMDTCQHGEAEVWGGGNPPKDAQHCPYQILGRGAISATEQFARVAFNREGCVDTVVSDFNPEFENR